MLVRKTLFYSMEQMRKKIQNTKYNQIANIQIF